MTSARFLSVELYLSALGKKQNKRDLRKALETLPKDLDNIYRETFQRISAQAQDDVELATRVLAWLSYSRRPMIVEELQHALAVEPDTKMLDWDNIIEESVLVSVCGGLVTIEDESRVIRLVHFTTQEYITGIRQEIFPSARLALLVSCLTYLQYEVFTQDKCEKWKEPGHPFARDCNCEKCLSISFC